MDYDAWKTTPDDWYDPPTPEDEGYVHEDDLPCFEDTRIFLKGICEALYETGDIKALEDCLEELCCQYETEFSPGEPKLEVKNKNRLMHWYLGYQRATIEHMRGNYDSVS